MKCTISNSTDPFFIMKSTYTHNIVIYIKTYFPSNSTNIDLRGLISYSLFSCTMYDDVGGKKFITKERIRLVVHLTTLKGKYIYGKIYRLFYQRYICQSIISWKYVWYFPNFHLLMCDYEYNDSLKRVIKWTKVNSLTINIIFSILYRFIIHTVSFFP